ncbi:MAG: DUF4381 domain-containing protein [Oleispira sp.]|nr:DUF4381 domain-containing protein [Oleispira sp.]MBL4882326.1 DUF4381 domain-containing protein [Oleispira sp.]
MAKDSLIEQSDSFGNYLIHGIDEVILPAATSWWPSSIGWQIIAFFISAFTLRYAYRKGKNWWHDRYRRQAISKICELQNDSSVDILTIVEQLPFYLKATALRTYSRDQVAQLSGLDWFDFLNEKYGSIHFTDNQCEQLIRVSYRPKSQWQLTEKECLLLIDMTKFWIKRHV